MTDEDDRASIAKSMIAIQCELKAPKDIKNQFQGWAYRKTEDILEAVKPLLLKYNACITLTDRVENIGDRYYVVATAIYHQSGYQFNSDGWSREPLDELNKNGQPTKQQQQITGSSSTYARKIALCGLLAIDGSSPAENASYSDPDQNDSRTNDERSKQLTDAQVGEIVDICKLMTYDTDKILQRYSIKTLYQLTLDQHAKVIKGISALKQEDTK